MSLYVGHFIGHLVGLKTSILTKWGVVVEPESQPIVSESDVAIWAEDNTPIVTE